MRWLVAVVLVLAAAVPARAQTAGTLRFPIPRAESDLTPYGFESGYQLVTLVYDTLTWRDEDGVPRPWLARSIERDGLRVRVQMRDGVRWHDGRRLTAHDVVYTYRLLKRRRHPRFTPQVRDIASIRALGDRVVELRLRRPSLGLLDQPFADVPILARHAPARLGSGPYRVVGQSPLVLEANPRYFMGAPAVRRIELPVVPRADRALDQLRAGRLDAVPVFGDPAAAERPGVATSSGPSYSGTVLMFNLRQAPFDRPEIRRALAQALDLRRIGSRGRPADRGYLSPSSQWALDRPVHRPDADAARVAIAEQGVPRLTVLAPRGSEIGRRVVLALRRAGARADLAERTESELGRAVGLGRTPPRFQLAIWPTPALASYDPAFLRTQFGSGETLNYSGYASDRFDALADRLDAAATPALRRRTAEQMLRLLAEDLPVVPLVYEQATFAYRSGRFDGWRFVKGSGILDKRSFLSEGRAAAAAPPAATDPVDRSADESRSLFPLAAGGALLLLAAVAAVLFRRRRQRV